jgi:hypothetical protein
MAVARERSLQLFGLQGVETSQPRLKWHHNLSDGDNQVLFSPNGQYLATVTNDSFQLWSCEDVRPCAIAPDSKLSAFSEERRLYVVDVAGFKQQWQWESQSDTGYISSSRVSLTLTCSLDHGALSFNI